MANEQKSATMVTINLKVSMCRDIIANSNITKSYVLNPYDSCNTDVHTLMIHTVIHTVIHTMIHTLIHTMIHTLIHTVIHTVALI